jgi:hypothetical protein
MITINIDFQHCSLSAENWVEEDDETSTNIVIISQTLLMLWVLVSMYIYIEIYMEKSHETG